MWYMQVGVYIHNYACALVLLTYWLGFEILIVFALSNLTIAVKFLTERKRR